MEGIKSLIVTIGKRIPGKHLQALMSYNPEGMEGEA